MKNEVIRSDFEIIRNYTNKKGLFKHPPKELKTSVDRIEWYIEHMENAMGKDTAGALKEIIQLLEYDSKNQVLISESTAEEISAVLRKIMNAFELLEKE